MDRVNNHKRGAFFIDGPRGTGKTFLYLALLATIRSRGEIALATVSCGVTVSILPGGRIAHSRFKIPINEENDTAYTVKKQSGAVKLIKQARLIIRNKATIAKKYAIECLIHS